MSSQWSRNTWLDAWTETSTKMVESMVAANRATMAALSVAPDGGVDTDLEGDKGPTDGTGGEQSGTDDIEPASDMPTWETDVTAERPSDLAVGDRFAFTKTITDEDVRGFARASGDTNPLHLDNEYAEQTRFGGRIAHGTLVGGLISAALARMPGLVVYLSQDLEFRSPARIGERVTAECEIVEDLGNSQFRLSTVVSNDETTIIDGEAVVLIDDVPETE
ncbi:MAG: 3-hydroxybutyryl-CoA dehydratase [Halovenus sp.]|jgi:3-hydroxybutyryl-CoA dehydratase